MKKYFKCSITIRMWCSFAVCVIKIAFIYFFKFHLVVVLLLQFISVYGMSESYRESHPLLYEELSEEEKISYQFPKRFRPMVYRSRARNNVKGAIAIIKHWPEHWTTSLTYWWIALGMISLITLIVYNVVAVLSLPSENTTTPWAENMNSIKHKTQKNNISMNVYMHLFTEYNKEVDLSKILPSVETISNKYPRFKYYLYIITNDTAVEGNALSAEENNENALNFLWSQQNLQRDIISRINIKHFALSKYMENSPLKKTWREIPLQFSDFFVRAVSIWDKGGITFNPLILKSDSSYSSYRYKLLNILQSYHEMTSKRQGNTEKNKKHSLRKVVNNIRDVIDALENGDVSSNSSQIYPIAAESKNSIVTLKGDGVNSNLNTVTEQIKKINRTNVTIRENRQNSKSSNDVAQKWPLQDEKNNHMLPIFLDFLFHKKQIEKSDIQKNTHLVTRKRKHVIINNNTEINKVFLSDLPRPTSNDVEKSTINSVNKLTLDLEGNILASNTPCHAFLGTIFSNSKHYSQETVSNFIASELSVFCKGNLSSCNGIDVILL